MFSDWESFLCVFCIFSCFVVEFLLLLMFVLSCLSDCSFVSLSVAGWASLLCYYLFRLVVDLVFGLWGCGGGDAPHCKRSWLTVDHV